MTPPSPVYTPLAERQLAAVLLELERLAEAEPLAARSYAAPVEKYGDDHEETQEVAEVLERIREKAAAQNRC